MTSAFAEFAKQTLIEQLGNSGEDIFTRVMAKKPIDEKSGRDEISEFIQTVERVVAAVGGQEKANEIALVLGSKLQESKSTPAEKGKDGSLNAEIEEFFKKYELPTDADITDYVKYLALKYGGNAKKVEKDITERVKINIRKKITQNRIREEIAAFLTRFPEPQQGDIKDFATFIRLSKLDYPEDKLLEQIEKARLYRKFHGAKEEPATEVKELDKFINFVKSSHDKEAIGKMMQKQGLSYLIRDEKGVSYTSLSEFVDLITPNEEDMKEALTGMGLMHIIKKK